MKLADKLTDYKSLADSFLAGHGYSRSDIKTGAQAWAVASRAGITHDAYAIDRSINDAHIQTALEKIFPEAVFKDPKRY
jgi:hypothetical protein